MTNEFLNAYQSIKNNSEADIVISRLDSVNNYLLSLNARLSKNGLKEKFVLQTIFSTLSREKDVDNYIKANLCAASFSLVRMINLLKTQSINDYTKRLISDFLCDLKPFILRIDDQQNFDWLFFNTNTHITNFYFDLAQNIFYTGKSGNHIEEQLVLSTSTPFVIRQCIEYKIQRILGIDYILIDDRKDTRIMEKCFSVLKGNSHLYRSIKFDIQIVQSIYKWCHEFIHGGYRAAPWKTENALHYLGLLFYELKTPKSISIYGAVEVDKSNKSELYKSTEQGFSRLIKDEFTIKWLATPEVAFT